jgi:hypothetical protein
MRRTLPRREEGTIMSKVEEKIELKPKLLAHRCIFCDHTYSSVDQGARPLELWCGVCDPADAPTVERPRGPLCSTCGEPISYWMHDRTDEGWTHDATRSKTQ